ncbi:MAG: hypothetical protein KDE15_00825 [Erythrobacter sp.]|nr:hypothetical protein [Erythrobacter sp.]
MVPLALAAALAACVPPAPQPTPVPSPAPTPVATATPSPTPTPTPQPSYADWLDAPQTPGDWHYVQASGFGVAGFGTDRTEAGTELIISCDLARNRLAIGRKGRASGAVDMRVTTETQARTLSASPHPQRALVVAELTANDSLLDAIAFSRGRFMVEVSGQPTLYVPAWPEITRVVEDCRR